MVLNLILIGLAIALDPLPLSAFMVVPSKRGVRKGAAWTFGWLVSPAIAVTVTVLATGNNPPSRTRRPQDLDGDPHRSGHHPGKPHSGFLAHRKQPLPDRHLRRPKR